MKKTIKLLLTLTAMALLGTLLTFSAFAAVLTGKCGDNLTYKIDNETCVLEISGTGEMTNYSPYPGAPWYSYTSYVKTVKISDGVTSIGKYAFYDCSSLGSIVIPDSVTSIGSSAFYNCSSLTSVTIPNSVTSIGSSAFYNTAYYNDSSNWENDTVLYIGYHLIKAKNSISGSYSIKDGTLTIAGEAFKDCISLTSITIPDSVTDIGWGAFAYCKSLTSETIPDSVTSIGNSAFYGCSSLTSVTIPDSVTSIGNSAFSNCSSLTSVTIPNSVTSIGISAFYNCSSLTSIVIPNSVTSIGSSAFYNTAYYNDSSNWENDTVLYIGYHLIKAKNSISGSYSIKDGTLTIAGETFRNCTGLTSITIPDSVTSIGVLAFAYCYSLTSVTIPDSVTSIDALAFYASRLISITIPDSVTSIGSDAFASCSKLTSIDVKEGNTAYCDIDGVLFSKDKKTLVAYPGAGATKYIIPNNVMRIGNAAFSGCGSLTSVTIPDSVTSIGNGAFDLCGRLTNIEIPDSVTSIGDSAFWMCRTLASITIPNSVTSIGVGVLAYCDSLTSVDVEEGNTAYCDIEGVLFSKDKKTLVAYSGGGTTKYVISDNVTSIVNYAFCGSRSLESVTIPDSVTSIGDYAFSNCSSLTSVTFKAKNATISSNAFNSCSNLETIYCYKNSTADEYFSDENYTKIYLDDINVGSIEIGSATAFGGDTVSIDITLSDCQGISGLLMKLDFDRDALTLKEIIYKNEEVDHEDNLNEESGEDHISIVLYNEADVLTNGVLVTLVFEVAENAVVGDHIIDLYYVEATNQDKVKMDITETDGKITVCKINYGDVNSDGEINIKDIVLLAQYLADWSVTIDPITADCDADGKISIIDIVLLAQFLAGWGVTLG